MRFLTTLLALATAAIVLAAPASNSVAVSNVNNNLFARFEAAHCPKASRYACGQYMLEDGTRQDFESQVYKCIPHDQFICQPFKYSLINPTNPGQSSHMIAAKVDPGCTCFFYSVDCDATSYYEAWKGWESEPNSPPWNRPAYTDKKFVNWWCREDY